MKYPSTQTWATFVSSALFLLAPGFVYAQSVTIVPHAASTAVGETTQIDVQIDTGTNAINAADGSIVIPDGLDVVGVTTGGSAFTLWPVQPTVNVGSHTVTFTGGVPGGLAPHTTASLLNISVKATRQGTYTLSSKNISFYKNDGTGAPVAVPNTSQNISVYGTAATQTTEARDATPPHFVYADIGRDASLFNNAWYLSFSATDNSDGTVQYQVKEGLFSTYSAADRYYVLRDQNRSSFVFVRATDSQGNTATTTLWPLHISYALYGIGIALILLVLYVIFKVRIL